MRIISSNDICAGREQQPHRWNRTEQYASIDPASGRMDVWSNTNMLNFVGWLIAITLKLPPHMVNFYPMYTGGSFGSKHVTKQGGCYCGSAVEGHRAPG